MQAGRVLATYQIAGSISRPIWGWIADRFLTPAQMLAMLGFGMAITALVTGFYARLAALGGAWRMRCWPDARPADIPAWLRRICRAWAASRRTEATGLGTAIMFGGSMAVPAIFGWSVSAWGGFHESYVIGAACALVSGIRCCCRTVADGVIPAARSLHSC